MNAAPSSGPRRAGFFLLAGVCAVLLLTAGCAVNRIKTSAALADASEPLQAYPPNAVHRLLIVGDSTAVGTGASSPQTSVAGLIARDHPRWAITNRAQDGAKMADVLEQLRPGDRFDTVLVMAGGNDVIRMTEWQLLRKQVLAVAEEAREVAPRVILMPSGNVGNAPFFFAPLSWWMTSRSKELHAAVREAAQRTGAAYVNLYQERESDPFAQQPDVMNAPDKLHPSDAGYAVWYRTLKAQAKL